MRHLYMPVFLFCLPGSLLAEPVYELETQVVTGTRTSHNLSTSPVKVEVIDASTLQMLSASTLAQALNFIPGVVMERSLKQGYTVQMQGFEGKHVLVLLNGQPLIRTSDDSVDLDQISSQNVERIEIVRGAASVLYGSAAMGGVINIITSQANGNRLLLRSEQTSYANNSRSGELRQTWQMAAQHQSGNSLLGIDLSQQSDPGFDFAQNATDANNRASEAANGNDSEKQFLKLSAQHQLFNNSLNYQYENMQEQRFLEKNDVLVPGQGYQENGYASDSQRSTHTLSLRNDAQRWAVNTSSTQHNEDSGDIYVTPRHAEFSLHNIDSQYSYLLGSHDLTMGISATRENLAQRKINGTVEIADKSRQNADIFVQDDFLLNANTSVLLGMRAQQDSDFGAHQASRISLLWDKPFSAQGRYQLRIGYGQSYRVPDLKERFYFFDHSHLGYIIQGNSDLKPETADSINVDQNFQWQQTQLGLNLHYSEVRNLIENQYDAALSDSNLTYYTYQNIYDAYLRGADISLNQNLGKNLQAQINYSYLDARDGDDQRLLNRPRQQIKANLRHTYHPLRLNSLFYLVYQADEAVPVSDEGENYQVISNAWWSCNFALQQQFNREFSWKTGINNIFDQHKKAALSSTEFDARPNNSREIFLGITYQY